MTLRILFAANTPPDPDKGAPGCDLATIAALRDLGHEVDEIWAGDMPRRIDHGNLHQFFELPRNFARAVAGRCLNSDYDVIQVNQPHAWLAAREHRRLGRPGIFVNRSHGWEPHVREAMLRYAPGGDTRGLFRRAGSNILSRLLLRHNDLVIRYADGLVVGSVDDLDWIRKHQSIERERVLALAPGIPATFGECDMLPMTEERSKRLLYSGQFAPFKAPRDVAAVISDVLGSRPEATMTWVCDRSHHDEVRGLLNVEILGRVTLLPWMSREELRTVYDRHGIFLQPSYFEGFCLTFLEAMSRGMCVLATDIAGMNHVIHDEENGFLFGRGDVSGMVERARLLLDEPALCVTVSNAARTCAVGFTWRRTAEELIAFYQRLAAMKRSGLSSVAS